MAESYSIPLASLVLNARLRDVHLKASLRCLNIVEVREMIMLQLDPLSLLNLISVSGLALATFNRSPTRFLNSTLAIIDINDNAGTIPVAIVEASKTQLDDGYLTSVNGLVFASSGALISKFNAFLKKFVRKGQWRFPDGVQQPLDKLRQIARIHEAVETLMDSNIWTCIRHPNAGANTRLPNHLFSKKEEMKRVLWVYQLYCTLYHRPGTAGYGEVLFPSKDSQFKYIRMVSEQESDIFMKQLVHVYRDLSSFLGKLYEDDWARPFYVNYKYYSMLSQDLQDGRPMTRYRFFGPRYDRKTTGPEFWSDRDVIHDTQCDFYRYIGYQMSKGLPHLAQMYRLSLKPGPKDYPVQKYWTDSFFTAAFSTLDYGRPEIWITPRFKGFLLEPLEEGKKGYKLSITAPSSRGHYVLQVAEPLFADEEFKPAHLGSLAKRRSRRNR